MGVHPGRAGAGTVPGRKAGGGKTAFVLRRMRAARLLPASLLLAVLISATVTTALASFGAQALPAGVRQRLASVPGSTVAISGQIGAGLARADTPVIVSTLRRALGKVPFSLISARWSSQLGLPQPRGQRTIPLIQAADLPAVRAHTDLAAGTWPGRWRPGQPIGVVLPVTTASLLHLTPGEVLAPTDTTTGAPVPLRVTGLFRPRDPAAPYWRLSLLGASGRLTVGNFITYGPALADPSAFAPGGLSVGDESWLATIDTARIHPAGIAALGRRLSAAAYSLAASQNLGGLQVATGLPAVLAALGSSLVVTSSLLLIGWLELLLLAAAAAALAARLLASQREEETALLSARGVARGQLGLAAAAEATVLAVTGAAAGVLLGSYLARLLMSASGLPALGQGAGLAGLAAAVRYSLTGGRWLPAIVIAVLVIVVMVGPAFRPATPGAAQARRGRQAALATVAQAGLDAALIVLAALAFWELRRYSAAPRVAGGRLGIDPVLAVAPALALAGAAVIPLRLLPAAARLLDAAGARSRRLRTALAGWQLSRRPQRQSGPVLLVVLAVATGTLALAQHQSWRQSQLDRAAFAAGADVRVGLTAPLPPGRGAAVARVPGVLSAMPVTVFDSGFSVFAVDARAAAATVLLRPDLSALPATALWRLITPVRAGPGLPLPGRPARLGITAMLTPGRGRPGGLAVTLSVQDGWGVVYSLPAGTLPPDGRYHLLAAGLGGARAARYPLRLLGLTLSYQLPGFPAPPYPGPAARLAAMRAKERTAAARSTVAIGALAVSARTSGPFPAAFAQGGALRRWHAAAASAAFADPHTHGIGPAVTAWRAGTGAAWLTFSAGAGFLLEPAGTGPVAVSGQLTLTAGSPALPVPAVATRAFLAATSVHVGGIVPLPVGDISVPVRLVAAVRAFPTAGTGPAVVVDQAWLQEVLAAQSQPPLPVTQWWLRTGTGVPAGRGTRAWLAARAGLPAGASVTTWAGSAAALLHDPLPNVPQLSLLVIVLAAALLAAIGFAVSVVASVRERRLQDALLAALGVGKADRAGQLCLEQLMLSLPAAAAGVLIGVVLAHLLAPAVTLTSAAAAPFPPVRVVVPAGWTALLALAIAAVPVLTAAASAAYRPDPAAQLRAGERA